MRFLVGKLSALAVLCAAGIAAPAWAQPLSTTFTYQGELRSAGTPAGGQYDLHFRLYDAATGGAQVGSTLCSNNVTLTDGRFTVDLDFGAAFAGQQRFLEVEVRPDTGLDCSNVAGFILLAPRQPLTAAPNSLFALSAAAAGTATTATNATQLNGQSAAFYQSASNITAGTLPDSRLTSNVAVLSGIQTITGIKTFSAAPAFTSAGAPFNVSSTSKVTNLNADLLDGLNSSAFLQAVPNPLSLTGSSGAIIYGENTATAANSSGVVGFASGATGVTYGGLFENHSNDGRGVWGYASANNGATFGVIGETASPSGRGVYGLASASTGNSFAGSFRCDSNAGTGVWGYNSSPTGFTIGVIGESPSPNGTGVYGYCSDPGSTLNQAVWGENDGGGDGVQGRSMATTGLGNGVFGWSSSQNGHGVFGYNFSGGSCYGVFGSAASTGYAVWANGRSGASGTKSFRIDHPDDPTNKYLLHYSVESPEVLNAYSGKSTLDAAGEATIELPYYFAKINKDPRYTLTPIGAPMPALHIAQEIDEHALDAGSKAGPQEPAAPCSFRIAGGAPGAKVSWRVEAVRNDLWMRTHGAAVEEEKLGLNKGTYQHPDLYGQPAELGSDFVAARAGITRPHPK